MKLAQLKKLEGEALLNEAVNLHNELSELKKNSVAKEKYEEALGKLTTLKQSEKDLKSELLTLQENTVAKVVFDQKVELVNCLTEDKNILESQVEELTVATVETVSQQTHFLIPGILGEDITGLICQSITEKFIGESCVTVFGDEGTPLVEALLNALVDETIPEKFVLITSPCVAINPFSLSDLKILKSKKNGDFNTGLPVVFGKENLINLGEFDSLEDLINAYFICYSDEEIPMKILDVGPDNLKCGVYRTNPRMDLVENALVSKKFYCFDEKGLQALQPIFDKLYPKLEEEE